MSFSWSDGFEPNTSYAQIVRKFPAFKLCYVNLVFNNTTAIGTSQTTVATGLPTSEARNYLTFDIWGSNIGGLALIGNIGGSLSIRCASTVSSGQGLSISGVYTYK